MVDPKRRLDGLLTELRILDPDVALVMLSSGVESILKDFATNLAEQVVGRLVINGHDAHTVRDIAALIQGYVERYGVR